MAGDETVEPGQDDPDHTVHGDAARSASGSSLSETLLQLDKYRVLQRVGSGGMGDVYLAQQVEPIRRRVALKVIKRGMDTEAVVARFESERQALALMDHACIAKVYDGGVTPDGRPYFVMEFVKGVPITDYCEQHRLGIKQRLELFLRVCDGVQHAHQKGIIHRDLKPTNVLVTLQESKPTPNGHLMLQRFDFNKLSPIGEPRSLGSATASNMSVGQRLASASHTGVLTRTMAALVNTKLVWLDRKGVVQGTLNVPEGRYEQMAFSPNGERIAVHRRSSPTAVDLYIIDTERESMTRFSFGKQSRIGGHPAWSHDGSRIAFSSNRLGPTNIYWKTTRGTEEEELLYQSGGQFKEVDSWSPDDRYVIFEQADPITRWDLWLLPLAGDRTPVPFLKTGFEELFGNVSPDGRWIAYTSDASGVLSLHIQSFPTPSEDHPVMTTPGLYGFWTRNGKQLLVVSPGLDPSVWSVPVTIGADFSAETPQFLFNAPKDAVWIVPDPDGDRFLASIPVADPIQSTIIVDVNWPTATAVR